MNDVGGGRAPLRNGSGGLGMPRAESSGKPGALKNIEFAPPILGASFINGFVINGDAPAGGI